MRIADAKAAAQVLFVDIDGTNVRFDVILLEQTIWGTQLLPAGAPISIAVRSIVQNAPSDPTA